MFTALMLLNEAEFRLTVLTRATSAEVILAELNVEFSLST